jgi:hypothetical protein
VLSGFIAASIEDEAPLFPALALGVVELGLLLPTAVDLRGLAVPPWVLVCQCLLIVAGPAAGTALRVCDGRRRAAR